MSDLKPAEKMSVQDWMVAPATGTLMKALYAHGSALFVGGCVRNALLGAPVEDVDIATPLTPEQVIAALDSAGIKHVPTGIEHGTVTAVVDGKGFEVTTLRKDVETDGRRAVVAFSKDWREDAQRRDFTMNTLLADQAGQVFDPLGQGLRDLKKRRVVFVGEADQRIREDYLRILRFFRFHALYGQGQPDPEGLKACARHAGQIKTLSRERITQEFLKIIAAEKPSVILALMFDHGVLKEFQYAETNLELLGWVCDFQSRFGLGFVASRILVLAGLRMENVEAMSAMLLLPKVFIKDMQAVGHVLKMPDLASDHAVKVAVYKHGRVPTAQALMIELAQDRVSNKDASKALEIIQKWNIPDFPVSGNDLIKAGSKPGPALGEALTALEERWIAEGFPAQFKAF
jgi:poly(A) polymerase